MKKRWWLWLLLVLGVLGGVGVYTYLSLFSNAEISYEENPTIQSNYYQYINKDWFKSTEIPADQPAYGAFNEVYDRQKEVITADLKAISQKNSNDNQAMQNLTDFYEMVTDFDKRESDGVSDIKKDLDDIKGLKNAQQVFELMQEESDTYFIAPLSVLVTPDPGDSSRQTLLLTPAGTFLPDPEMYENKLIKKQVLGALSDAVSEILKLLDYSDAEIEEIISGATAFDELLIPYQLDPEAASDVSNIYTEVTVKEIEDSFKAFDLVGTLSATYNREFETLLVPKLDYLKDFHTIVSDDHFSDFKNWMIFQTVFGSSDVLTEDIRQAGAEALLGITGAEEIASKDDTAQTIVLSLFGETYGQYYGKEHFGEEAKTEVEEMVKHIIDVYRNRLNANDWLEEATKTEAVKKLDQMTYHIGYSEDISELESLLVIDKDKSLYATMATMGKVRHDYEVAHFNDPIDKEAWIAPAFDINAYYSPTDNSINFPAGILSEPFYDFNQSLEEKYGAIGVIIGHELTHAFDDNGSLFDENGNMANWWTEKDHKAFKDRTQAMTELFDGLDYQGHQVNGKLTVTENTADAGGLSSAYQALHELKEDADDELFFTSYARIWREKPRKQYLHFMMQLDPHAPNELRANRQLSNFEPFYETYDISEKDAMFIPKEDRVTIW